MPSRPIRAALFLPNERERTKSARPAPRLTFATQPDANTGVFHSTKGLRQGPGPAKQCAKPRSAKLRLASRLPQTGPIGSGVHFCEYSARQAVCIRIESVNQRLQAHIYCVLEQASRSDGTQTRASGGATAGINSFGTRMLQDCGGADSNTMLKTPFFARRSRG